MKSIDNMEPIRSSNSENAGEAPTSPDTSRLNPAPQPSGPACSPIYQCGHCKQTFSRVDHLSRHVRIHTLEKPHSCPLCKKSFGRTDLLKKHRCRYSRLTGRPQSSRTTSENTNSRVSQACTVCAASKLKCSEQKPCHRCVRKNIACVYGDVGLSASTRRQNWQHDDSLLTKDIVLGQDNNVTSEDPNVLLEAEFQQRSRAGQSQQPATPESQGQQQQLFRYDDVQTAEMSLESEGPIHVEVHSSLADQLTASAFSPNPPSVPSVMLLDTPVSLEIHDPPDCNDQYIQADQKHAQNVHSSSTYTDFLKEILYHPSQDNAMGAAIRSGAQTPYNIWDTFMTTSPDWDHDLDLSALPSYPNAAQFRDNGETGNTREGVDGADTETNDGLRLGVEAFKTSFWNWVPSPEDTGTADQTNLSLPSHTIDAPTSISRMDPDLEPKHCSMIDRERVLGLLVSHCEKKNIVRIISSFPSTGLIEILVNLCLRSLATCKQCFIHVPSFEFHNTCDILLTALIAFGACLTSSSAVRRLGYAIPEILRFAIVDEWDKDNSKTRDLQLLQSWLISISLWFWSGNKRKMEISESFMQPIVTIIRRSGMLNQDYYKPIVPTSEDEGAVLEGKWRQWAQQESRKRMVHYIFAYDAQASMMHLINPLLSSNEYKLPLPEPNELWHARSATAWKACYLAHQSQGSITRTTLASSVRGALFQNIRFEERCATYDMPLTLHGLWSFVWQCRQEEDMMRLEEFSLEYGVSPLSSRTESIAKVLQAFQPEPEAGTNTMGAKFDDRYNLLLSFLLMSLYVPLQWLEMFAGKNGERPAHDIYAKLQEWTCSRESRLGIWYAGQIISRARRIPSFLLRDFYAVAVYRASLALYTYGIVSATRRWKEGRSMAISPAEEEQLTSDPVWLEGKSLADIRRFIVFGEGNPVVGEVVRMEPSRPETPRYIFLHTPGLVMQGVIEVLRRQERDGNDLLPPFVENLSQFMGELKRAAQAVGFG